MLIQAERFCLPIQVEQAKEAERLRLKLLEVNRLAETCKDLDDFRRELDRLNKQQ